MAQFFIVIFENMKLFLNNKKIFSDNFFFFYLINYLSRKAVELLVTKAFTNSSLCRGKHWNIKSICFFVCDKFEIKLLKLIQTPERQNPERKIPEK